MQIRTLKYLNIKVFEIIEQINIYCYQHFKDLNIYLNFIIDILLKSLIIAQQFNQYQKTKKYYKNCNKRIIVDNYNFIELQSITNNF